MLKQYSHFFFNGVLISLLAWLLQYLIFIVFGNDSSLGYAVATAIAFSITMVINFFIQMRFIFKSPGAFHRYVISDLVILVIVSLLSPLCRLFIAELTTIEWGNKGGFLLAALIGSVPSFLIKRFWVFTLDKAVPGETG